MSQSGYDINTLIEEAQIRWLKPAEVLYILQNHYKYLHTQEPPQKPTSGSLFLFNTSLLPYFQRDGHNWLKTKDGRTFGEAHEQLEIGVVETLHCYSANGETLHCYSANGEENPYFLRRSYWTTNPNYRHIVFVHYRDINIVSYLCAQEEPAPVSAAPLSPVSYSVSWPPKPSPSSSRSIEGSSSSASFPTIHNQGSTSDSTYDYNRNWDLCVFED